MMSGVPSGAHLSMANFRFLELAQNTEMLIVIVVVIVTIIIIITIILIIIINHLQSMFHRRSLESF